MLLLHKGGLNHLWKALKIIKVLKCWDLSDLSIPDRKAKNPKSYIVNWEDFPANPDGNFWKEKMAAKHSLWLLWPVSWEKEACMPIWCAYPLLSLTPTPFQLFLSPLAITASCDKLHWRSSSTGSWTGVSHGENHLKSWKLVFFWSLGHDNLSSFLTSCAPHQTKEIQPQDRSLLKKLFPYLTAGWLGLSLWQEFG